MWLFLVWQRLTRTQFGGMKRCVISGLTEPIRRMKTSHRIPHANDLDGDVDMSTAPQMLESRGVAACLRADGEWHGSELARDQLAVDPLGLVKSLVAPVPVGIVDLKEVFHE